MTRLEEARERVMDALDAWVEHQAICVSPPGHCDYADDLVDTYAALKRAENGEPEDG